jgi:hypothetical protein
MNIARFEMQKVSVLATRKEFKCSSNALHPSRLFLNEQTCHHKEEIRNP